MSQTNSEYYPGWGCGGWINSGCLAWYLLLLCKVGGAVEMSVFKLNTLAQCITPPTFWCHHFCCLQVSRLRHQVPHAGILMLIWCTSRYNLNFFRRWYLFSCIAHYTFLFISLIGLSANRTIASTKPRNYLNVHILTLRFSRELSIKS